jgi:hypothetical protein
MRLWPFSQARPVWAERHGRNPSNQRVDNTGELCARTRLDSIPFRGYHVLIIALLGRVGFIDDYDLVITGSLLVLAKAPLQLTDADNRWLIFGPPLTLTVSGFAFSAVGDRLSRKTIMLFGVTATTFSPC